MINLIQYLVGDNLSMRGIKDYLNLAVSNKASELIIVAGKPLSLRINGEIRGVESESRIMPDDSEKLIRELYVVADKKLPDKVDSNLDEDFSFSIPRLSRFRVNVYKQRGSLACVVKVIQFGIPNWKEIGIIEDVMQITKLDSGLALVTGPAGCGKSTTLACLVDEINRTQNKHIITIEDPIEFLHKNQKGTVSQRELISDTYSYTTALRACLRQAADVIVLSEISDIDTLKSVLVAIETGHLVISTLHTPTVSSSILRLINMFPVEERDEARVALAQTLKIIVSQRLLNAKTGGMVPAFEIMTECTSDIKSIISNDMYFEGKANKIRQIDSIIRKPENNMIYMDKSIYRLYKIGRITAEEAVSHAIEQTAMRHALNKAG